MGTIALKLILVALYAWLYSVGGRAGGPGKWVRRWLGSAVIIGGLYGFSIIAGTLSTSRAIAIPFFFLTAFLGYGGDTFLEKFLRRSLFGLVFAGYAITLGVLYGNLLCGLAQAFLCLFASLFFGLVNPIKAADEEAAIGLLSVCLLPFIVS